MLRICRVIGYSLSAGLAASGGAGLRRGASRRPIYAAPPPPAPSATRPAARPCVAAHRGRRECEDHVGVKSLKVLVVVLF